MDICESIWGSKPMKRFSTVRALGFAILVISIGLVATAAVAAAAGSSDSHTINVLGKEVDRDRVAVPSDWGAPDTKQMKVQAAYNGEDILFRARFP